MNETKAPRELLISKKNHKFYEELKAGKHLPELKGYDMAYLFAIAMAYGVHYKKPKPIPSGEGKASISRAALDKNFEWLIRAVALSEADENIEVLPDQNKIYKLAEEYANGGIDIIKKILEGTEPGKFQITIEKELNKVLKET